MLREVLQAFKDTSQPLSLSQLAQRLDVDRALVEEMIGYWVRKGKLKDTSTSIDSTCTSGGCSRCGVVEQGCPYVIEMPRRFELVQESDRPRPTLSSGLIEIQDIR